MSFDDCDIDKRGPHDECYFEIDRLRSQLTQSQADCAAKDEALRQAVREGHCLICDYPEDKHQSWCGINKALSNSTGTPLLQWKTKAVEALKGASCDCSTVSNYIPGHHREHCFMIRIEQALRELDSP